MTQWKPKQLVWLSEWRASPDGLPKIKSFYAYALFCLTYRIFTDESNEYAVIIDTDYRYPSNMGNKHNSLDEAKAACQADFERRWQSMSEPQPFWKPIEQCPRVEFREYFLYRDGYGPWVGFYKNSKLIAVDTAENLDIRGITHYAEIPPLEASK